MIINNTYFKGEIYIPHAKTSITDTVRDIEGEVVDFINEYSRDCLFKCLGSSLFYELESKLNPANDNGLIDGVDVKWDSLLNGTSYIDPNTDKEIVWRGIRFKSIPSGSYDKSFLASYVYYFFEEHDFITRSDVGHQIEKARNADVVTPTNKVVKAWRKFVMAVQGGDVLSPEIIFKNGLIGGNMNTQGGWMGVDYFNKNNNIDVSLYKFIEDSNLIDSDNFKDFTPMSWENKNQYGI